ncbi:MAG: PIN domain nuclease [Anaerolineae bacterium]|nr:PIN domain nuclease [Anaerolineae bacterium]
MDSRQVRTLFRIIGALVLASLGIAMGSQLEHFPVIPTSAYQYIMGFTGLAGCVLGWVFTPRLVLRPFNRFRRFIDHVDSVPATVILGGAAGLFVGLALGAIAAYPVSYLPEPLGEFLPFFIAASFGYAGLTIMVARPDLLQGLRDRFSTKERGSEPGKEEGMVTPMGILLDTSVIIDGRITDICRTGFIQGELVVPLFVLNELQHVADSADTLRRNRGRRGLEILRQLQEESPVPVHLVDEDMPTVREVDDKLIALAKAMDAAILTNDYNLNRVAELQSVRVLNVNELANAVKTVLLPGETFTIYVLQEGKEYNQGVGYLDDGTMVVVEDGAACIGTTIDLTVNKVLQTAAGRMIFARPRDSES